MKNKIIETPQSGIIDDISYTLVRTGRKNIRIRVLNDGNVEISVPLWADEKSINENLIKSLGWIKKTREKNLILKHKSDESGHIDFEEIRHLADEALKVIPERVKYYAPLVGVSYGRITIRNQKTRWGSCTARGNLNFNCLLMLAPPEVLDSVVVHELCHRLEMNHSKRFYAEVLRVYPDYYRCDEWLKKNGPVLMRRAFDPAE